MNENEEINQKIQDAKKQEKRVQHFREKMIENAKLPDKDDKRRQILIVDDDIISLRTFSNVLNDDYRVAVVKTGMAAIDFIKKEKPDLILLDYEMPEMDGAETLKEMRLTGVLGDIPVFFLTAVSDADWVKKALELKPEGYILKTSSAEELKKRIKLIFQEN